MRGSCLGSVRRDRNSCETSTTSGWACRCGVAAALTWGWLRRGLPEWAGRPPTQPAMCPTTACRGTQSPAGQRHSQRPPPHPHPHTRTPTHIHGSPLPCSPPHRRFECHETHVVGLALPCALHVDQKKKSASHALTSGSCPCWPRATRGLCTTAGAAVQPCHRGIGGCHTTASNRRPLRVALPCDRACRLPHADHASVS